MSSIDSQTGPLRAHWQPRRMAVVMLALAGLALAGLAMAPAALAAKAYKWVDEHGNVSYQDRPPPESASVVEERNIDGAPDAEPGTERDQQAATAAEGAPVTLYVVPDCAACELVRAHLGRWEVSYSEKNVEQDTGNQAELVGLIGRLEIPTLRVGEDVVRGYTASAINDALAGAGYPVPDGQTPQAAGDETAEQEAGDEGEAAE